MLSGQARRDLQSCWLRWLSDDPANTATAQGNIYNTLLVNGDLRSAIANLITGSGNDTLIGNNRDNRLTANAGGDTIDTKGGDDTVSGGPGADTITFGSGNSILRDTLADLNGDVVFNFGGGAVDVPGALLGAGNIMITPQQATLTAGASTVVLNGSFIGGEFLFSQRGTGADVHTTAAFVPYLPALAEGVAVSATAINGIASQPFLTGDGMAHFVADFQSAVSAYGNQLGGTRSRPTARSAMSTSWPTTPAIPLPSAAASILARRPTTSASASSWSRTALGPTATCPTT